MFLIQQDDSLCESALFFGFMCWVIDSFVLILIIDIKECANYLSFFLFSFMCIACSSTSNILCFNVRRKEKLIFDDSHLSFF